MTEFGYRLIQAMELRNLKQVDLIDKTGISKSTLSGYVNGTFVPKQNNMYKLATALQVSPTWLMGYDVPMVPSTNQSVKPSPKKGILIPVYGTIPAGVPVEAIEDVEDWEEIPEDWTRGNKQYIALKVRGDSMYPKYLEGDTVIIKLQPDCENGEDAACYVNGYDATLKTIKKGEATITLQPINPNYPPSTYRHPGEVKVLGKVVELRRKI